MQKLLVVTLVALLFVLSGETIYFVWQKQKNPRPANSQLSASSPTSPASGYTTPTPDPNHAIRYNTLETFMRLNKQVLYASTATNTLRGRIMELGFQNGALKLQIEGVDNPFLFSSQDLPNLRVIQMVAGKEEQFSAKDLKVNDNVLMDITIDLTKDPPDSILSAKITKLK